MSGLKVSLALERPGGFSLDVDLDLPAEGVTALFGPSGSGKTTVLRCVAGLEHPARARIVLEGEVWEDSERQLNRPTWQRALGYVFQEASLFEHLTVARNLAYGQKRSGAARVGGLTLEACVALLGIGHLLDRRPAELSGGERQRVAIARALATNPRLLLLDEPLSAIDAARKQEILPWLERLRDGLRIPMLYVTHSAEEMARLATTVVVLEAGRAVAQGPLSATLARLDVPQLLGEDAAAVLEGTVVERDAAWHLARVQFAGGSLWVRDAGQPAGQPVRMRVLARDVSVATEPARGSSIQNALACTVRAIAPGRHPSQAMLQLECGGVQLLARITARAVHELALAPGRAVWAQVKSAALVE